MSAPEIYHTESVVNFNTIHSTLTIYPDGKKVYDSMLVSEGKTVSTPRSHKEKLLKKIGDE